MAELCLSSSALWKVELVRDIIGYLAEEIFFFRAEDRKELKEYRREKYRDENNERSI